jgi:glycosyltransferase involved in cell wall biosynthesis
MFNFRKKIIKNYVKGCKFALLYYKTDAFTDPKLAKDYTHTNYWESVEIARILNEMGYVVDIINRTAIRFDLEDKYELFIGIGAGDSGQHYPDIAKQVPSAIKIMYALGPEPKQSNKWVEDRYCSYSFRHGKHLGKMRRTIDKLDIDEVMKYTDVIITCGNEYIQNTYKKFNKPIYRVYLSTHPDLKMDKTGRGFLYFGGNGNIVKGLDLVIEALTDTNLQLYICAPFEEEYQPRLSPNIHWEGFVKVGSDKFNDIVSKCGYVILPSCSEACATSVTTCMRKGLIPIVTRATGIDIGDFGYLIENCSIIQLREKLLRLANGNEMEFKIRQKDTYKESFKYTQENFTRTFKETLWKILQYKTQ